MARAAWPTTLKVGGDAVSMTGEATTNTTGNTYQVTNTAKRVLDWTQAITVKDGGTPVSPASIDWLAGKVTLSAPPGGAVTIDGYYLPMQAVVEGKAFGISGTLDVIDVSAFGAIDRTKIAGLREFSVTMDTFDDLMTDLGDYTWMDRLDGAVVLVEIDPAGLASASRMRFLTRLTKADVKGAVDGAVNSSLELTSTSATAADGSLVSFTTGV